jgi:cardiolipin synthase C
MIQIIEIDQQHSAYRLRLSPDGEQCQWVAIENGVEVLLTSEPDSSIWLRLKLMLLRPLVPHSQL